MQQSGIVIFSVIQGYRYAGTQQSVYCFCGNKYDTYGAANTCNTNCKGNPNQICGGSWANSVYETSGN